MIQQAPGRAGRLQRLRLWAQIGFFVLFVLAPLRGEAIFIAACNTVQERHPAGSLLEWVDKAEARANEARMSLTGRK